MNPCAITSAAWAAIAVLVSTTIALCFDFRQLAIATRIVYHCPRGHLGCDKVSCYQVGCSHGHRDWDDCPDCRH